MPSTTGEEEVGTSVEGVIIPEVPVQALLIDEGTTTIAETGTARRGT